MTVVVCIHVARRDARLAEPIPKRAHRTLSRAELLRALGQQPHVDVGAAGGAVQPVRLLGRESAHRVLGAFDVGEPRAHRGGEHEGVGAAEVNNDVLTRMAEGDLQRAGKGSAAVGIQGPLVYMYPSLGIVA